VAIDAFGDNPATGCFLIVDAVSGTTVAGGVVTSAHNGAEEASAETFRLTRELLHNGLCRDLGESEDDRREFQRRANEAALLLHAAGIPVKLEL
jgi:bifunctional enzyme CysN/CysC